MKFFIIFFCLFSIQNLNVQSKRNNIHHNRLKIKNVTININELILGFERISVEENKNSTQTPILEPNKLNGHKKRENKTSNQGTKKPDKPLNGTRKTVLIVIKKPSDGSYGTREQEKARLQNKFDKEITGNEFEHEHIIGVNVLIRNSDERLNRDKGEGKKIEKLAPAYYEIKELHRKHVGTGTGPNADKFRDKINEFMIQDNVAGAMIENVREYGEMKEFRAFYKKDPITNEFINDNAKIADDSFNHMIKKNPKFSMFISGKTVKEFSLRDDDKFKIITARHEAMKGTKLSINEIKNLKQFWDKYLKELI